MRVHAQPRLLGWLVAALLLAALAIRVALPSLTTTEAPLAHSLPPVPPVAWLAPAPATEPPRQAAPPLAVTIVGSLRHPEASHTILVLDTPDGQRVAGEGDRISATLTLEAITPDGVILDHQGRQQHLAWPEPPAPTLMLDTE
ncbi:type II secretion system protein N [Halomonas sp. SSL-5]|uniref:type II secretion system protein N n=1 Tax=Halomonas sp. SSL-5 TaxID=3065855 RepID=UPI002738A976|nr:type II secretion system protein N [Halomonas sp. SSL-5]MDY7117015.1 type II secretion system protein N [Halomonas sp. SSL-5]